MASAMSEEHRLSATPMTFAILNPKYGLKVSISLQDLPTLLKGETLNKSLPDIGKDLTLLMKSAVRIFAFSSYLSIAFKKDNITFCSSQSTPSFVGG